MSPTVMRFDEPTSALDPELIKEVLGSNGYTRLDRIGVKW